MTNQSETKTQEPTTLRLSDCPALLRMHRVLSSHLTRVWPTRLKALTPPAMAGLTTVDDLALDLRIAAAEPQAGALTVFLPRDFKEGLAKLVSKPPVLRVQPDIGMMSQGAYLSFESGVGYPPLAVWVELPSVLDALARNELELGQSVLPILLVAGDSVVVYQLQPDEAWLASAQAAIEQSARPPGGLSDDVLRKAAETVKNYSERPWLFMRYELKNGNQRLAVNWAPVKSMYAGAVEQP